MAIDAVPWEIFDRLQSEGKFSYLFPASRLVAPFPSLTDVSFTLLLGAPPSAGYEDVFFDPVANRIRGGLGERLSGEYRAFSEFHERFDWEEPHLWGGAVFVVPDRVPAAELHRLGEVLEERRDEDELVVYLGSTDGLGHVRGRQALVDHLVAVDRFLRTWLAEGEADRRVVLFSDHGMSEVPSEMFDLAETLRAFGFRLADRIDTPIDVVAPAYGLVGSIALYTACGQERAVARAVVAGPGADFAVWQDDRDRRGAVDRHGDDPFGRRSAVAYPDLERRAFAGLALTRNPASVLVSLDDGWHWGSRLFDAIVDIEGTHGSARASSSVGFLASNVDRTPATIDAGDAHRWLRLEGETSAPALGRYRCVEVGPES